MRICDALRLATIVVFFGAAVSGQAAAPAAASARSARMAALPDWAGLWETQAAARLGGTGTFEAPILWSRPATAGAVGDAAPQFTVLPPAVKICTPGGFPAVMEYPVPDMIFEWLVTPEQTVLIASDGTVRHIYTDGRTHPGSDDLWPTPEGHSIGRWDRETLVIDTVARAPGPVGPVPGVVNLSSAAHFTERLRRIDSDTLVNDMTIEDPETLTGPWRLSMRYERVKNVDRMIAVDCRQNDRNPVVDGSFVIAVP